MEPQAFKSLAPAGLDVEGIAEAMVDVAVDAPAMPVAEYPGNVVYTALTADPFLQSDPPTTAGPSANVTAIH